METFQTFWKFSRQSSDLSFKGLVAWEVGGMRASPRRKMAFLTVIMMDLIGDDHPRCWLWRFSTWERLMDVWYWALAFLPVMPPRWIDAKPGKSRTPPLVRSTTEQIFSFKMFAGEISFCCFTLSCLFESKAKLVFVVLAPPRTGGLYVSLTALRTHVVAHLNFVGKKRWKFFK